MQKAVILSLFIGMLSSQLRVMAQGLPITHYKYQTTRKVCQQLAASFGEQRLPKLIIVSDSASRRIAQFVPKPEPTLFLDEKLYDLCREFNADSLDALAIIIGHELSHYYTKHADCLGFAHLLSQQKPSPAHYAQNQLLEAQADLLGTYHAFLAGYSVYPIARQLYVSIYKNYQLPEQMSGYPNRTQRIALINEQSAKVNTLGMAYDVGLLFMLSQRYNLAERCFYFVSEEVPTKELLNNIGLCQLLMATQAMSQREMPFRYPFELATTNRLRTDDHRGGETNKVDLLKQAITYFRQAIELDDTYESAYINLASALSLLGRNGSAKELIDELEEMLRNTGQKLPTNARLLRGITLAIQGHTSEAEAELTRSQGAYSLTYNLEVARQYNKLQTADPGTIAELLNNVANSTTAHTALKHDTLFAELSSPFSNITTYTEKLAIPEPNLLRIQGKYVAGNMLYQLVLPNEQIHLVCSRPTNQAQTKLGIRVGDSEQTLRGRYGEPQRMVTSGRELTYYCYDYARFFVAVNQGIVRNWFMYYSTKH